MNRQLMRGVTLFIFLMTLFIGIWIVEGIGVAFMMCGGLGLIFMPLVFEVIEDG